MCDRKYVSETLFVNTYPHYSLVPSKVKYYHKWRRLKHTEVKKLTGGYQASKQSSQQVNEGCLASELNDLTIVFHYNSENISTVLNFILSPAKREWKVLEQC